MILSSEGTMSCTRRIGAGLVFVLAAAAPALAQRATISSALQGQLEELSPSGTLPVWVFFRDRGPDTAERLDAARDLLQKGLKDLFNR